MDLAWNCGFLGVPLDFFNSTSLFDFVGPLGGLLRISIGFSGLGRDSTGLAGFSFGSFLGSFDNSYKVKHFFAPSGRGVFGPVWRTTGWNVHIFFICSSFLVRSSSIFLKYFKKPYNKIHHALFSNFYMFFI